MRVEALHHLVQEGFIECDPLLGGHRLIMGAVVEVARAGATCAAGARFVRPFASFPLPWS
jgi:hypothetical protein